MAPSSFAKVESSSPKPAASGEGSGAGVREGDGSGAGAFGVGVGVATGLAIMVGGRWGRDGLGEGFALATGDFFGMTRGDGGLCRGCLGRSTTFTVCASIGGSESETGTMRISPCSPREPIQNNQTATFVEGRKRFTQFKLQENQVSS